MSRALLGIDTGGTFTDFVLYRDDQVIVHKVLSRPDAPEEAILQGIRDLDLLLSIEGGDVQVVHGTTVATNAVLEQKGVRTAYITNRGLGDTLLIGRQTRAELYNLTPTSTRRPFDRQLTFEVDCRLDATGAEVTPLTAEALDQLVDTVNEAQVEAIAINLLFSFLDDQQERAIASRFEQSHFVSRSSFVMPEYREYERGITTWINAWIGPRIHQYLTRLATRLAPSRIAIMQSSGLTISADQAAGRAVNLLLSGPAGGLAAAKFIGETASQNTAEVSRPHLSRPHLITFDMGGTSTDVALLEGEIKLTSAGRIDEFPIGIPMADIHTIGAGGGSIAWIDEGGLLQVGPASAGAAPGPACYGNGGTEATVTDANLVLGRLQPHAFLGGAMNLNLDAARTAVDHLAKRLGLGIEEVAQGIIEVANEHMTQALRVISIQQGYDPRKFTLTCFGGAGGLHVCDLAENLEMDRCMVPIHGGVLSALGMLTAPPGREVVVTRPALLADISDSSIEAQFAGMTARARDELAAEGIAKPVASTSLDLRYAGQTFTINVPFSSIRQAGDAFEASHEKLYGHRLSRRIELLNLRVHLAGERYLTTLPPAPATTDTGATPEVRVIGLGEIRMIDRSTLTSGDQLTGPLLLTERHSTTLIKPGWEAEIDQTGNVLLRRE